MTAPALQPTRRELIVGAAATALTSAWPRRAHAAPRTTLVLDLKPGFAALAPGKPDSAVWALTAGTSDPVLRYARGDEVDVSVSNQLPVPAILSWRGLDGAASAGPLIGRKPIAPGGGDSYTLSLRHAGTMVCDARLLGDNGARPPPSRVLIVGETEPVAVDQDEVFLIEDWRVREDGAPVAPGSDSEPLQALYTINGKRTFDLAAKPNSRLRIRFINSCQRSVVAIKTDRLDVRVMAIDGQPSEPFLARDGVLVMAPGTRVEAFIDAAKPPGSSATISLHDGRELRPIGKLMISNDPPIRAAPLPLPAPLPSNGLPAELGLKSALRVDLTLNTPQDWLKPSAVTSSITPAFRVKRGRTVVLALTNRAAMPAVFHLHGHHFRLLDKLDDGWKPFWLDTLAIEAGQTQRVAFAAEHAGSYLMESMTTDWASLLLLRSYTVE